jgi:vacuolar-type H+-ATPase subunit H
MSGDPRDLSSEKRALRADTAERLEAIVKAAERAAESVLDDAEAEAQRYLAEARAEADRMTADRVAELSGVVDSLLGQANSLREEAERLQKALEEAKAQVAQEGQGRDEPEAPATQPEVPRLRAVAERDETPEEAEERRTDAAGARLLATQMAVSGSSREEIEQRLRNGFQIEDTDAILDAILGPED